MSDTDELARLSAQYCHRFDDGELDALVALFSPDATIEFGGKASTGPEQLTKFFTAIRVATQGGRHLCTNHEFHIDGENATGISDFMVARIDGKPPVIGRYDDTYRKHEGRWQFCTRRITPVS